MCLLALQKRVLVVSCCSVVYLCYSTVDSCHCLCFQVGEFDEDGGRLVIVGSACSPLLCLSVVGVAFGLRVHLSVCICRVCAAPIPPISSLYQCLHRPLLVRIWAFLLVPQTPAASQNRCHLEIE